MSGCSVVSVTATIAATNTGVAITSTVVMLSAASLSMRSLLLHAGCSCGLTLVMYTSINTNRRLSTSTIRTLRACTLRLAWCSWTLPSTWSCGRFVSVRQWAVVHWLLMCISTCCPANIDNLYIINHMLCRLFAIIYVIHPGRAALNGFSGS